MFAFGGGHQNDRVNMHQVFPFPKSKIVWEETPSFFQCQKLCFSTIFGFKKDFGIHGTNASHKLGLIRCAHPFLHVGFFF